MAAVIVTGEPKAPARILLELVRGLDLSGMGAEERYGYFQKRFGIYRGAQLAAVFSAAAAWLVVNEPELARQAGYFLPPTPAPRGE